MYVFRLFEYYTIDVASFAVINSWFGFISGREGGGGDGVTVKR
jgi:hypothetical protein